MQRRLGLQSDGAVSQEQRDATKGRVCRVMVDSVRRVR